ncbi:hypothetical protein CPB83DRAFT_853666 [Crepidotus variabilis]|uniref:Uncharacterized protein n=1 Tax=Crepidotus variabilis TaxID=179855 RepID=A0A9P6JPP6_9AGAR|nr:hypothetical protein CPB83DRAFT_853666 [Crepidotus variabilis]
MMRFLLEVLWPKHIALVCWVWLCATTMINHLYIVFITLDCPPICSAFLPNTVLVRSSLLCMTRKVLSVSILSHNCHTVMSP